MKRKKKKLFYWIFLLSLLLFFASFYLPISKGKLNPQPVISLRITDRNHILLREVLSDEGGRCQWVRLEEISPYLLQATIASEDRQFFHHSGISIFSVARASYQNLKNRRVISGASTITQQVVRNIYHFRRNIFSKLWEAWLALRLEHTLSKPEILAQYLNRISYGNQAFGIEAASRLYFEKPSSHLSLAEAACLAAIPRSPSTLNPYRNFPSVQKRQRELIKSMLKFGFVQKDEALRALEENLRLRPEKEKFRAPHFCDFILKQLSFEQKRKLRTIQTTLDYSLQEKVEILLKNHLKALEKKGISNGAAVIMKNDGGEILSMVGSRDFFDDFHEGQVNGSLSFRQPGSTLKPITYALALEKGMTAATILDDEPAQFSAFEGSFMPENYDEKYHGPIRLRSALACSYNIPAVSVLQAVGPDLLFRRLKELEFESLQKSPGFYGVGLTLGNGEVSLLELCRAYSAFARGGIFFKEKAILKLTPKESIEIPQGERLQAHQAFSPEVSYVITHILSDKDARIPSFGYLSPLNLPFPVAAKTGTSKDFRDNWTLGYTPSHTVGIWVGNFDGKPMHNVSGITGCGPLFRDIMLLLANKRKAEEFKEPKNLTRAAICPVSGELPAVDCPGRIEEIFITGTEPQSQCSYQHRAEKIDYLHPEIPVSKIIKNPKSMIEVTFPQEGDIFKIDPVLRKRYQVIKFKAEVLQNVRLQHIEWWVNDQKIGTAEYPFSFSWNLNPGFYTIKAKAAANGESIESRSIKIFVLS